MKKEENICPVCGFDNLLEPAYDEEFECSSFQICPCCGYEFGVTDMDKKKSFDEYRMKWIKDGFKYRDKSEKPNVWDIDVLKKQLRNTEKVKHIKPHIVEWTEKEKKTLDNYLKK